MKWIPIFALMLTGVVMGQATKPAEPTFMGTWQQMRDELISLRAEVAKLRAENATLRKQPGARDARDEEEDIKLALRQERPEIGMTLMQWRGASEPQNKLQFSCSKCGATAEGEVYLLWLTGPLGDAGEWTATVKNNKIIKWRTGRDRNFLPEDDGDSGARIESAGGEIFLPARSRRTK